MHEILTLQFGPLANYVGTHFWNTQESYFTYDPSEAPSIVNHDISFRPGVGKYGIDTYTPRALIYDLKSGFGSLRKTNALYEIENQLQGNDVWSDQQRLQTATPIAPSPYQEALESGLPTFQMQSGDVRYWSDYNRVYFHPRSLVQLSSQTLTSQLSAFESYSAGVELLRDLNREIGGVFDRDVRPFAEECDSLQGFQVFGTSDDAWGGFMTKYVEELEEDFGKKSVWAWSLEDGQRTDRMGQLQHITNSTQTLSNLADNVSACIRATSMPTRLPSYVKLDATSYWSKSALLASVIESATLPTRLRDGSVRHTKMAFMEDLLHDESDRKIWDLSAYAQKATKGSDTSNGTLVSRSANGAMMTDTRIPDSGQRNGGSPVVDSEDVDDWRFELDFTPSLPQIHSVFPSLQAIANQTKVLAHIFTQIQSQRSNTRTQSFPSDSLQQRNPRQSVNDESVVDAYQIPLPFPILDSFPADLYYLMGQDSRTGRRAEPAYTSRAGREERPTIDIAAALSTTSRTKTELLSLRDIVVGRGGRMLNLVDANEREALYDDLTKMADSYTYGYEDDISDDENGQDD